MTVIENASRADQRVLSTTVAEMEPTISNADLAGPALTFIGLAPRSAFAALPEIPMSDLAQEAR